jgi:hypothetical protein
MHRREVKGEEPTDEESKAETDNELEHMILLC